MNLPALYNQKFIDTIKNTGQPYLDTLNYGIALTAVAGPSQPHWRIIGIHHLTGPENHGQHHLFVDVLNEQGERINNSQVTIRRNGQTPATLTLDKPANEPGTNTHMHFNDTLSISVNWAGLPSDTAAGFHTRHEDDDPPGTTRGHHSYYIVFQKTAGVTDHLPGPPDDGIGASLPTNGSTLEAELWAAGQPLIQDFNRETALFKKAQEQGLGEHLTGEYEVMHDDCTYIAQIFELGMVYVPAGQWDQVRVVDTATRAVAETGPAIFWDNHITGFLGNRGQYWDWHLAGQVPGLTRLYFKDEVVNQNPVLRDDGWVFKADKVYKMPRGEGQPAAPATAPLMMAALPPPAVDVLVAEVAANGAAAVAHVPPSSFVQARGGHFYINNEPQRFIGANIRGLVHYGHISTFPGDPNTLRRQQLQAAKEMHARLIRVFLPQKHTATQDVIAPLRETIHLFNAEFPDMYLLPALTDLYIDAEFFVKGDDHFYETQAPRGKQILNHAFYKGGYKDHYEKFVKEVVDAFKNEPRIFAWEIGNELKAEKTNGLSDEQTARLLVDFMTTMARQIKTWDSNHMVTTGMISTRHAFMDKQSPLRGELYGSPHIDFITIHPYNGNNRLPHEMGNPEIPVEDDMDLARRIKKPLIVEEAGFDKKHFANRPEKTRDDIAYWFGEGASCYMPWGFQKPEIGDGDTNIGITASNFDELYTLHRKCGEILAQHDVTDDIREAIKVIDFHTKDLESDLIWPLIADGFDFPVGKPDGRNYYVAAGLLDPAYHASQGFWHTGEDWNGIHGRDTDLGDPVYATAHGLVITAQSFPVWGNIVLLEHILPTGRKVWSQYAHLNDVFVKRGDIVHRGEVVGTIGKGGNHRYLAHLHFEIRLRKLPASKWWQNTIEDKEKIERYYAHPTNFIKSYRPR